MSSGRRSVSQPEKRIFPYVVRRSLQLVSCSQGSAGNFIIGVLPGKSVVNTNYTSLCWHFLLLFLYTDFLDHVPVCNFQVI
jgi:hypothetical protein